MREPVCVLMSACVHTREFFVHSLGQSRGTQRFEVAGEVDAKTGLEQLPAWAWLLTQSAQTQKALGLCTQQSQGQWGRALLKTLLPVTLTVSIAYFLTFPTREPLTVRFGSKPDLRASDSAVLGETPSFSCTQTCPHSDEGAGAASGVGGGGGRGSSC